MCTIEYGTIYRGSGFLAIVWFSSSSTPYTPSPVNKLSLFLSLPVCSPSSLLPKGGGEGGSQTARKPGPPLFIQYSMVCTIHTSYTSRYVTGNTVIQIRHIKRLGCSIKDQPFKKGICHMRHRTKNIFMILCEFFQFVDIACSYL